MKDTLFFKHDCAFSFSVLQGSAWQTGYEFCSFFAASHARIVRIQWQPRTAVF